MATIRVVSATGDVEVFDRSSSDLTGPRGLDFLERLRRAVAEADALERRDREEAKRMRATPVGVMTPIPAIQVPEAERRVGWVIADERGTLLRTETGEPVWIADRSQAQDVALRMTVR